MTKFAKNIIRRAKKNLKKNTKTGDLLKSIEYKINGNNRFIITQLDYGTYLEDKTHYMENAVDDSIKSHIGDLVAEEIKRINEIYKPLSDLNKKEEE